MNFGSFLSILIWVFTSSMDDLSSHAAEVSLGNWLEWSRWTTCTESVYCLEGSRQRQRQCEEGKRCVGIEEESEGCPSKPCQDRPVIQDVAYAGAHSFISQECSTVTKYHVKGKYAFLLRHNISRMFPKAKSVIESSFYNVKFIRKKLESEQNIFKYCFEPSIKLTLDEFISLFSTGYLRYRYTTIYCPLPKPRDAKHVTGIVVGVQESGDLYAIYAQVTAETGFKSIYYKRMPGFYSPAYDLIW